MWPLCPPNCVRCGRWGMWLCPRCEKHLTAWDNAKRWQPLVYPGLRYVWSAYEYRDTAVDLVKAVKYDWYYVYCHEMARLIATNLGSQLRQRQVSVLVPVPLHRRRQAWRGFNQSWILAHQLGQLMQLPVNESLQRHRYRRNQASFTRAQRQQLRYDFSLLNGSLRGERVCLVDDVLTTGSTLSACARAIETVQPQEIGAITFARTTR